MRAVIQSAYGSPANVLSVQEVATPVPKGGEVLVQVVRIHPDGSRFLLCDGEEMVQCFAEFYRIVGEGAR